MIAIKILQADDVEQYREVRLDALSRSSEAFGATYEEEAERDIEATRSRLQSLPHQFVLGAYDQEQLIGVVGFKQEQGFKFRHKGFIWGMYVKPEYRSQGVGRQLLHEAIRLAGLIEGLEQINLSVVTSNNAKALYESFGFTSYGLERKAMKQNGTYYDEELMKLTLPIRRM